MIAAATAGAPRALRGFEGIRRFWDRNEGRWVAQVLPGDYYVTKDDEIITTVLGSCVTTCVRDEDVGIGGLNHFMLPYQGGEFSRGDAMRYGGYAVERLINELVKYGARRERLEIKVFGGGKVIAGMSDIGRKNIDFVHDYFKTEELPIAAEDVGGTCARKVRYFPASGKAMLQRLATHETHEVVREEAELNRKLSVAPLGGQIILFD